MMGNSDSVEIKVVNFEKYNPESYRLRSPTWFRINRDIVTSPSLHGLTSGQKWLFVCVLSEACRKNSDLIRMKLSWLASVSGEDVDSVKEALNMLHESEVCVINYTDQCSELHKSVETTTEKLRLHDSTIHDSNTICAPESTKRTTQKYDIEALYQLYPVRKGNQRKKEGVRRFEDFITTPEMYERVKKAILNYKAHCEKEKIIGEALVAMFSSFFNLWEEWENRAPVVKKTYNFGE